MSLHSYHILIDISWSLYVHPRGSQNLLVVAEFDNKEPCKSPDGFNYKCTLSFKSKCQVLPGSPNFVWSEDLRLLHCLAARAKTSQLFKPCTQGIQQIALYNGWMADGALFRRHTFTGDVFRRGLCCFRRVGVISVWQFWNANALMVRYVKFLWSHIGTPIYTL